MSRKKASKIRSQLEVAQIISAHYKRLATYYFLKLAEIKTDLDEIPFLKDWQEKAGTNNFLAECQRAYEAAIEQEKQLEKFHA